MNKTFNILIVVGLTLIIGLLPSCGGKPNPNYEEAAKLFAADESLAPIMDEQNEMFYVKTKRKLYPLYMSEQQAIDSLITQGVYLVFATRRLTKEEENAIKNKQLNPRVYPLAYDALSLIVNGENPDTVITANQFRKILTGEITTWKEIYPESELDTIRVAFDNPTSSAVRYCTDSILRGTPMKTDGNIRAVQTSQMVVEFVEKHKDAIGIVGSVWLDDRRDTTNLIYNRNITVMEVGQSLNFAVKPHQYYIATGEYPFIRTIYAICTDPLSTGSPRRFANYLWNPGEQGQLIFGRAGLFPARREYSIREVNVE